MGLSLGEYGALHAAGVMDAETLLELLARRGAAMARASEGLDCAMTAVFSLANEELERAVSETPGDVWCCNYNCPGQTVIGGEKSAVTRAS
jgi:[acyl-carrier-protein] S-malonyltransferase